MSKKPASSRDHFFQEWVRYLGHPLLVLLDVFATIVMMVFLLLVIFLLVYTFVKFTMA